MFFLYPFHHFPVTAVAPSEILAQGDAAKLLYEKALKEGSVNVFRGRILLIGQDRAGKTSLKKSLLGLPFDPKEQSTEGVEVDPSKCEIEVDQIKNWRSTSEDKPGLSEFSKDISRVLAEKRYHLILGEEKEDSGMESEEERSRDKSKLESVMDLKAEDENSSHMNQVCSLCTHCISKCVSSFYLKDQKTLSGKVDFLH